MKKLLFFMLFVCLSANIFAQKTLTKEQYDALPLEVKRQIEMTTNYPSISWGKEIGIAVNESLTAIEQSALRIADSKIGTVATFLVIWKFCMRDVLGIIFSIVIMCFGIWGYHKFWKAHVKTDGLQSDGDYLFVFVYPIVIIAIAAMAMFA
jgi:hypothetical protein